MPQQLSGPGVGLPLPQYLYPTQLTNAPVDTGQNRLELAPGDALPLAPGDWYVDLGDKGVCVLQFLDPVTNCWWGDYNSSGIRFVKSDGFTVRVANLTGCVVAGLITLGGTGNVAATTSIASSSGGSTFATIVGGAATTSSIILGGLNYGVPPLVFVAAPPAPVSGVPQGIQATAFAVITNSSVSAISLGNRGAGYTGSTIAAVVLPDPTDPTLATTTTISAAAVYLNTGFNGQVTGALCTNNGAAANASLSVTSASGSNATVGAVRLLTLTASSITNGGAGWANPTELSTLGGQPTGTAVIPNPVWDLSNYRPRRASQLMNSTSAGVLSVASTIFDGGLFAQSSVANVNVILQTQGAPTSGATIGITLSSVSDTVTLQPAP